MQQIPKNTHPRSLWLIWATCLINLYPAGWRERYADEMLAILEEYPPTFWTLGDILVSLCDAHLHRTMISGRMVSMFKQFYSSITIIFSIGLMFCLFSFAIVFYLTDLPGTYLFHAAPLPTFFQPMVLVLMYQSYAVLILLTICGASLFLLTGRQALKTHHVRSFFLYLFSAFSPVIAVISYSVINIKFVIFLIHMHISINISILFWVRLLSMLVSGLIVIGGIWALKVALRSVVPGIRSTNFLLVLATMISVLLFAYSSALLFLIVYLVSSGFGTSVGLLLNGPLGLLFFVSILLASYSLVHAHQAWHGFKIQVQ